ncbi:hypothetical protein BDZ91DRAFT_515046 [Kalaharituber pfeilii]|nr:hypothetical protein BDZ91DRAFT_515046 [Kalaharituber pfeilii]
MSSTVPFGSHTTHYHSNRRCPSLSYICSGYIRRFTEEELPLPQLPYSIWCLQNSRAVLSISLAAAFLYQFKGTPISLYLSSSKRTDYICCDQVNSRGGFLSGDNYIEERSHGKGQIFFWCFRLLAVLIDFLQAPWTVKKYIFRFKDTRTI